MNPQKALELLNGICANVQANRDQHAQIVEAVNVLAAAINKPACDDDCKGCDDDDVNTTENPDG